MVPLEKGDHIITFVSRTGCDYPENDERCLSFRVSDFKIEKYENILEWVDIKGFFDLEKDNNMTYRWMSRNASIIINNEFSQATTELFITSEAFYKPRTLTISSENINKSFLITTKKEEIKLPIKLKKGGNKINFYSDSCDIPKKLNLSEDDRCLSLWMNIK